MKKFISLFLIIILISLSLLTAFSQEKPSIASESGILIDYNTGKILYGKNIHKKMYPASTTKVITALLTLENGNLDDKITIDYDLGYIDGSSMYIKKGETFTVEELLKAMLIRSANDAAVVLANYISGSVDEFTKLMNKRVKELGGKNSHFNNPNGLPDENHYTSAYDLSLIAREAMKYDKFREIVKTPYIKFSPTEYYPYERFFRNTNRFLWGVGGRNTMEYKGQIVNIKYDLIDGIKTGYTNVARQCLISSGEKDGFRLISVVLKSEGKDVYRDSRTLLDYGFENYSLKKIVSKKEIIGSKEISFTKERTLKYGPATDFNIVLRKDEDAKNISKKIILNPKLNIPIKKGETIGKIEVYQNKKIISKINLISLNDVNSVLFNLDINKLLRKSLTILKISLEILIGLIIVCLLIRFINKKIRKKKNLS
ncbi:D-alanyl-D-alanine carboxypeptidase family protein [Tepidibacter formicigenes]|jgi:D-alanyl-D-alanine carboxypeptidase (penicillin-binding protein 5/6)|uniref:serine-type D-Ala-D-Ala carboxypeptidase n=1 Tax=Tepidibacter formicigenes DSM 15518 TaxID=1123349 RepID=A0A1M6JXE1_9FIRM|nr:D-alanyl-D-alanine carboxypeptidase family protein [Tepidibacter formicigenes]SHJ51377.1 D-alanyl-D-alanine carboxypeptidase (penicillin-binding protein 5/6) [Tepidibacter formicigenes DSM 15518]